MRKTGIAVLLSIILAHAAWAEDLPRLFGAGAPELPRLGAAETAADSGSTGSVIPAATKSPRRAMLFSALVPGTGELYGGAEKRGIVFLGLEAVAWGMYVSWNGKGNDIDKEFRATADDRSDTLGWSSENYLLWRNSTISRRSSITHALPCSAYVKTGSFSDCGGREKQQYYEVLGKYDQFIAGWKDVQDSVGNHVEPTDIDSVENFSSAQRLTYEDRRDDSNRYLKRAGNLAGLILVNHVFSAIDAARAARQLAQGKEAAVVARRTRWAVVMQPGRGGQVPFLMAFKPFD